MRRGKRRPGIFRVRMLFPSAAAREHAAQKYGAVEGLSQTMDRLGERLAIIRSGKA